MLFEALAETPPEARKPAIKIDTLGIDLANISCLFNAVRLVTLAGTRGRLFLRNVRHGPFLVPFAVKADIGIGCPIVPSFALGGTRQKIRMRRNSSSRKRMASASNLIALRGSILREFGKRPALQACAARRCKR